MVKIKKYLKKRNKIKGKRSRILKTNILNMFNKIQNSNKMLHIYNSL